MLDIGWSELAIIAVVALFVIGPKELPKTLRTIGRYVGQVRAIGREFQASIDEAVREAELDDVKKQIESAGKFDVKKTLSDTIDPKGQIGAAMDIRTDDGSSAKATAAGDSSGTQESAPATAEATAESPPRPEPATSSPMPSGGASMSGASARAAPKMAAARSTPKAAEPMPEPSAASGTGTS